MLKWVRGDPLSQDHWLDLFRLLKMPRGMTLEKLSFKDILAASNEIIRNADALKELNQRAQGEVTIREAIRELELWGASAVFQLTDYEDSHRAKVCLIKDWKDIVNGVGSCFCPQLVLLLIFTLFCAGGRQPMPASVAQGLPVLQEL